jgi:hypothetical protein
MAKYHVEWDEYYPVFSLTEANEWRSGTVELTAEEHADYKRVCSEWDAWQDRLDERV